MSYPFGLSPNDGQFASEQIYAASSKNIDPQRLNYFKAKQLNFDLG
jgi:hypothetical protein